MLILIYADTKHLDNHYPGYVLEGDCTVPTNWSAPGLTKGSPASWIHIFGTICPQRGRANRRLHLISRSRHQQ
ncbi:Uncharacterized protein TCM_010316 [Theobroma cacao]|uniref:Uncharacterized protein n=1 Tax=Theobroma cacao TaxID=3641 RepID=A0A061EDT7_THECC|nr:Uncharacterized protein TCM_010316 [Theobroma cacao]